VPVVSRRSALQTLTAIAAGTATGMATHGFAFERHALELSRTDLQMAGLPSALDGLRIGFITDLHHSEFTGLDDIGHAVDMVRAERPDLILLGGDYISYGDLRYAEPCAEALAVLEAPLGVFAVLGNHDDDRVVPDALKRRGMRVLRDESAVVTRGADALTLAGIRFWTKKADEIARVIGGSIAPVLLAAHDPRRFYEAASLHVAGVLAGHTHGGQVVLPVVGAIAARKFPVAAGHLALGSTEMFVSRGVGTVLLPLRVNCPPEVSIVTLRRRQSPAWARSAEPGGAIS
jgi:uncharacterized protein